MESGTDAKAGVSFLAQITLYHLKFSTVWQSTNTYKILAVSTLTGAQSSVVPLILVMMSEMVYWTSVQNNQQVL